MQIRVRSCVPATPNEPQVLEHALHHDHSEKPAAENKFAVGTNLTILVSFFLKKMCKKNEELVRFEISNFIFETSQLMTSQNALFGHAQY